MKLVKLDPSREIGDENSHAAIGNCMLSFSFSLQRLVPPVLAILIRISVRVVDNLKVHHGYIEVPSMRDVSCAIRVLQTSDSPPCLVFESSTSQSNP